MSVFAKPPGVKERLLACFAFPALWPDKQCKYKHQNTKVNSLLKKYPDFECKSLWDREKKNIQTSHGLSEANPMDIKDDIPVELFY